MKQIDHDPRELPHKALKVIAAVTTVLTISIMVPLSMSIRWAFTQMPEFITFTIAGMIFGVLAGYYIGRWDTLRSHRTPRDG